MGDKDGPSSVGGNYTGGDYKNEQHAGGDIVGRDKITYEAARVGVAALHQLPTPPADFTGRAAELSDLRAAVAGTSPVGAGIFGLRGLGGVGKTALALVLAHELSARYPDAQLYVDLKGAAEQEPLLPGDVLASFIRAFEPTITQLPESVAERQAIYRSLLAGKRVLMLLDNASDKAQVEVLLPPAGCLALVTSRQHFALPGLFAKDLNSLPRADAVALLLKIAARIGLHADMIARLCGDLPLALRLAGSALAERPNLTPEAYIQRLQDEKRLFKELGEVEAALKISEALLTPELQARWHTLAVFPADFDWPAAAAVWTGDSEAADEAEATDALGELLRYSMLDFDAATARYRLHDLARVWAVARLDEAAEGTARLRHAEYYRRVLAQANDLYLQGDGNVLNGLALFDQEQVNIEAGQAWASTHAETDDQAAALCSAYPDAGTYVIELRYHARRRITWRECALEAAQQLGQKVSQGVHLGNLGLAYADLGEPRRAIEYHEQHLAIAREIGDQRSEGADLSNLGNAYADLGASRRAIEYYEQALVIVREIGDRRGERSALIGLGISYVDLGETRRAIEHHEQALVIVREIGDRRGEGYALSWLGISYAELGEPRRAIEYYEQALVIVREIGDRRVEGNALGSLGNAYADVDEMRRAIEYYEQRLTIAREIGDRRGEGIARWNMSLAHDKLGERQAAIAQAEEALSIYQQVEHPSAEQVRQQLAEWRQGE